MFQLCKLKTSVKHPQHNDIKNQLALLKNYQTQSYSGTVFNMVASGEDVMVDLLKFMKILLSENCYQKKFRNTLSYSTKP